LPPTLARERYESTVLLGVVFAPSLLIALPFIEVRLQQVATVAAAVALLAHAGIGAFLFRKQSPAQSESKGQVLWAVSLSVGVALSSLVVGAVVTSTAYAVGLGLAYTTVYLLVVSAVFSAARRGGAPTAAQPNSRAVAVASALGAAACPLVAIAVGKPFFASVAALLYLVAGVVATINFAKLRRHTSEA
jgi:hypothetical protein